MKKTFHRVPAGASPAAGLRSASPRFALPLRIALAAALALVGCAKEPATIKVKGPRDALESVKMNPTFAPFEKKGDTIKLRASAFDADGAFMGAAQVKWDSSDRTVATVDQTGLVTILSSGDVEVSATTTTYKKELKASLPLKAIIIGKVEIRVPEGEKKEIHLGETKMIKAVVLDDRGNEIKDAKIHWRSSSFAATITDQGELEGRAIGNTTLYVEAGPAKASVDYEVLDWPPGKAPKE